MEKRGQIWVETAIYTLIGLTVIAIALSIAMPQIQEAQDRAVITQTMDILNGIDRTITEVSQSPGNIRIIEIKLSKGRIEINSTGNYISYIMEDTNLKLSEPEESIKQDNIIIKTQERGKNYDIILNMSYENFNITYGGEDTFKTLQSGEIIHKLFIENKGVDADEKTIIDFRV